MAKKQLLVTVSDYHLDDNGAESLDAILAMGVFDLDVDIYFTGQGIQQVLLSQPALPNGKNLAKQWASAPIYGLDNLWVCQSSHTQYNGGELIAEATIINSAPKPADYKFHLSF